MITLKSDLMESIDGILCFYQDFSKSLKKVLICITNEQYILAMFTIVLGKKSTLLNNQPTVKDIFLF